MKGTDLFGKSKKMIIKDIWPGDDEGLSPEIRDLLSEVMIPISFAIKNGEEPVIWALEPLLKTAINLEECLKSSTRDIKKALKLAEKAASDYAVSRGFTLSPEDSGLSFVYKAKENAGPTSNLPVMLTEDNYDEASAFDYYFEGIEAFGIIENGKVVSAAATNPNEQDETNPYFGYTEIGVETLENYKGRGYASMCLASLTAHLQNLGKRPIYVCPENNLPSLRTAEKAGLLKDGAMYFCVCRSIDH